MNSVKSCISSIRSNALLCGLLLAFIVLVAEANEQPKRAGFVGMRGKKDAGNFYDMYGFGDYSGVPEQDMLYELKRGSSGFVGMRGKKSGDDNSWNLRYYIGLPNFKWWILAPTQNNCYHFFGQNYPITKSQTQIFAPLGTSATPDSTTPCKETQEATLDSLEWGARSLPLTSWSLSNLFIVTIPLNYYHQAFNQDNY